MTTQEIRWRCERLSCLLETMVRRGALETLEVEAIEAPWLNDPRPAPAPLLRGYIHSTPADMQKHQHLDSTCGSYAGSATPWGAA